VARRAPRTAGPRIVHGAGLGLAGLVAILVITVLVLIWLNGFGEPGGGSASGSGSSVPALPEGPPGFSARPTWGAPVADYTRVSLLDGRIALRDGQGKLALLDAANGSTVWKGSASWPKEWVGPVFSRVDGRPVIALASRTHLAYSPLDRIDTGRAEAPDGAAEDGFIRISLPPRAKAVWTGTAPLVTDGAKAWLVKGSSLRPMALPAQARPVTANGDTVIAVAGRSWVRSTGGTYDTRPVPAPPGLTGPPARLVDVAGRFLFAVWPASRSPQAISLIDTSSGLTLLNNRLPAGVDVTKAPVVRQSSGAMTAVGQVIIDPERQRVDALLPQYTPRALASGRVYAVDTKAKEAGTVVEVRLPEFTVARLGKAPTPFAVATLPGRKEATAFVLAADDTRHDVLALPPRHDEGR
jgi:hypothetical protein